VNEGKEETKNWVKKGGRKLIKIRFWKIDEMHEIPNKFDVFA
jgi:hypothetical protein